MDIIEEYRKGLSIHDLHKCTGIPLSTIRFSLLKAGVLRSRSEALKLAAEKGKLGSGLRGKTRTFTAEHRQKIREGKLACANTKGVSLKPNGYIEITRGPNKGRGQHAVVMEAHIGRKLCPGECVHHIDGNRSNNDIHNLQLMTRSQHTSLHRKTKTAAKGRLNG